MKRDEKAEEASIRDEYDFCKARKNPYAERANQKSSIVVIESDLFELFPSSEAVNRALRLMAEAGSKALQQKAS